MATVNTVEIVMRQLCLKPFQHFGYGKRMIIIKEYLAIVTTGLYSHNVFCHYYFKTINGRDKNLVHKFLF
jgi:hypothetical protein